MKPVDCKHSYRTYFGFMKQIYYNRFSTFYACVHECQRNYYTDSFSIGISIDFSFRTRYWCYQLLLIQGCCMSAKNFE